MRFTYLGLSTLALATTLGACSGYNSQSYGMQNQTHHQQGYAQHSASRYGHNTNTRPPVQTGYNAYGNTQYAGYGQNQYVGYGQNQYAGYGQNQHGTVLRSGAPYGAAVHNAPYTKANYNPNRRRGVYSNLGVVSYSTSEKIFGVQGRLGYNFNKNFATEIEGSFGVAKDDDSGIDVGVEYSTAAFVVGKLPITKNLTYSLRGGYHRTNLTGEFTPAGSTTPVKRVISTDGPAVGHSLEYAFGKGKRDAIRFDVTAYDLGGTDYTRAASVAYVYKY